MLDLDKTKSILRKYRKNAIDRNNKTAQQEVEQIMKTITELYKWAVEGEKDE